MNKKLFLVLACSISSLSLIGMQRNDYSYMPQATMQPTYQQAPAQPTYLPAPAPQPVYQAGYAAPVAMGPNIRSSRPIAMGTIVKAKIKQMFATGFLVGAIMGIPAAIVGISFIGYKKLPPAARPGLTLGIIIPPILAVCWYYLEKSAQNDLRDEYIKSYFNIDHPSQIDVARMPY